jgi:hypothetical protein
MDWNVDSTPYHHVLDADQTSFTIAGLPQGTLVSDIKLQCSSDEREGQETHPTISASTHSTTPPRISQIGDFSTAAGEMSHDQSFTVDDDETHAGSLKVWGVSLDESIVPSVGVEIRGVGQERSVRVEPLVEVSGVANILVTVKDREGLTASTTFKLYVEPNWFYFFPTRGYAGSSTVITIHGAGFKTDSTLYSCQLHAVNPTLTSDALSVGSHEIACTVPAWPVSAQTIVPQLLYNGYPLKQSEQARDIAKKLGGTYKTKVICSSMNCTLYELCSFMNCTLYDYESPNYDCAPSILS